MLQLQLQLQLPVWLSDQGMLCALKFTRKKLLESGWTFFPTTTTATTTKLLGYYAHCCCDTHVHIVVRILRKMHGS